MFGIKKAKGGLKQRFIDMNRIGSERIQNRSNKELLEELFSHVSRTFKGLSRAKKSKKYNEEIDQSTRLKVDQTFWDELIEYAKSIGIDLVGFTEVDEYFIFEEEMTDYRVKDGVLDNAIVLGMEMDKNRIEQAPEPPAGVEAMKIYADLGDATNKLAQYLRERGFKAQAFHPFGGPVLYPPIAEKAGLGEIGVNGVLISREFGPRQRLSMIATDASPLPDIKKPELGIREYCKTCEACVKACPGGAIYPSNKKKRSPDGKYLQNIDGDKCFPHFFKHFGCSICIKVCPFSKLGYDKTMKKKRAVLTATTRD
ncbi:MAG: 4Fe-4S double cluster binding domain-containing protein [Promethearchaeota archaeon]